MVSSVAATCGPVVRNGYKTLMTLLCVAVLCLLILPGEVSSDEGTTTCPACPTHDVYNPVNNIQITTCDATVDVKPIECNASCLSCDELLPLTNQILRQLGELRNNTPSIDPETNPSTLTHRPRDCKEVQTAGFYDSGRYAIYPDDDEDPFFVFCDMETDGGGWTVFQRRQDGSVDFYVNWTDYKLGFGSVLTEHWLGNEKIHRLTSQGAYELRVDLEDFEGNTRYAEYDQFLLADETLFYQLILGDYDGDAGDSLTFHNGMKFTTKDMDLDVHVSNCAQICHGAWWYRGCYFSSLNGDYLSGPTTSTHTDIVWKTWKGVHYSLKKTEMKIRPVN